MKLLPMITRVLKHFFNPVLFVLIIAAATHAQPSGYDFTEVDANAVDEATLKRSIDSLTQATHIDSLRALLYYVSYNKNSAPRDYGALVFGLEFGKFSFNELNAILRQNGFDPLTETLPAMNIGIDAATGRWLISWLFNIRIKEKLSNDDVRLSFANSGMVTFAAGYDILNMKRIQLYPQASLSYQKFSMDIRRKDLARNEGLLYYLDNTYESNFRKRSLAGQAGLQLDVRLTDPKKVNGVMISVRGGFQKTLIDGEFRMHHRSYDLDLGDVGRQSYLSVGLKFFVHQ